MSQDTGTLQASFSSSKTYPLFFDHTARNDNAYSEDQPDFHATVIKPSKKEIKIPIFSKTTKVLLIAMLIAGIASTVFGSYLLAINFPLPLACSLITGGALDLGILLVFVVLAVNDRNNEEIEAKRLHHSLSHQETSNDYSNFHRTTRTPSQVEEEDKEREEAIKKSLLKRKSSIGNLRTLWTNPESDTSDYTKVPTVYTKITLPNDSEGKKRVSVKDINFNPPTQQELMAIQSVDNNQ